MPSGPYSNAQAIQTGLRVLPGLSQVTVTAVDAHHFLIDWPTIAPTASGADEPSVIQGWPRS